MLIFLVAGKLDKVSREQWDTKVGEKSPNLQMLLRNASLPSNCVFSKIF